MVPATPGGALADGANTTLQPCLVDAATGAVTAVSPYDTASGLNGVDLAPQGIYFSRECPPGVYTRPTPGVCDNASHPLASTCAFGEGDDCQRCPTGALCPGGYRAIPQPGYYVSSLNRLPVLRCPAPAEERCTGWNATLGAVQCGVGYRPGSYRCLSCARGYFTALDGGCDVCPPTAVGALPAAQQYRTLPAAAAGLPAAAMAGAWLH